MTTQTKLVAGLVVLLAVFLAGFLPQYLDNRRLNDELGVEKKRVTTLGTDLKMGELRDLCGMTLLEVLQQNYGLARELSTQYFEKVGVAVTGEDPRSQPLRELLDKRDSVTAMLAQSDAASSSEIQALCRKTVELTRK